MYLLDTNVVSELRKPRPHGGVLAWLQSVTDGDLHLSAVTLGEIVVVTRNTADFVQFGVEVLNPFDRR